MSAFGRFDLGGVMVIDVATDAQVPSTDTAFITVGEDEINIDGPRAPAIAAFVVRACNAHDELLAALKQSRGYVVKVVVTPMRRNSSSEVRRLQADAAKSLREIDDAIAAAEARS